MYRFSYSFFTIALVVLAVAAPAQNRLPESIYRKISSLLTREFSAGNPGGVVLVAKRGRPVFLRAYGMADIELGVPMRTDNVFGIGSITKQFTAVAILKLVEEGKVGLDDAISDYLPDFQTHGRRITIEQILTHTAGLPSLVDLDDFEKFARQDHTVPELLALTRNLPLHFEPNAGYRYSDTGYIALGAVIEKVSGMSYGDFVESKIFRPLRMNGSFYGDDSRILPRRARGYSKNSDGVIKAPYISMSVPHAAGSLVSTVEDLLRWDVALRKGGVLRKDLLERAWSSRTVGDGTNVGYGFGWNICSIEGHRTIEHGGWINGFTARAIRFPDKDLNIIVLVNNDADNPDGSYIARRIARLILSGSSEIKLHSLAQEQRMRLAGLYLMNKRTRLSIIEKDGILYSQWGNGRLEQLIALSPNELTFAGSDASFVFRFEIAAGGRAAKVRTFRGCTPPSVGERSEEVQLPAGR